MLLILEIFCLGFIHSYIISIRLGWASHFSTLFDSVTLSPRICSVEKVKERFPIREEMSPVDVATYN